MIIVIDNKKSILTHYPYNITLLIIPSVLINKILLKNKYLDLI